MSQVGAGSVTGVGMGPAGGSGTLAAGRRRRGAAPEEVVFPVTPMLDMAFQLLAFFVLTFQAPSAETRLDLDLPIAPTVLPGGPRGAARAAADRSPDADFENDLYIRLEADDLGDLRALRLGEASVPDVAALGDRLRRYREVLRDRPLRVRLVADDGLRYEEAARVMAACSAAGVAAIRLSDPGTSPVPPPNPGVPGAPP